MFNVHPKFGVDTTAYLHQAGQFMAGQTNYRLLTSPQGLCFYPAGHLWHYAPLRMLFEYTSNAEYFLKLLHYAIASSVVVLLSQLGYLYFKRHTMKA